MVRLFFWMSAFAVFAQGLLPTNTQAHEPYQDCPPIQQPIDLIGPIGNDLRASYRRVCNRPRYLTGKLSYWIAPTSQEAMAWHKAEHCGAYEKDLGRIEPKYFYPKPWERLKIGPRVSLATHRSGLTPVKDGDVSVTELVPSGSGSHDVGNAPPEPIATPTPDVMELPEPDESSINIDTTVPAKPYERIFDEDVPMTQQRESGGPAAERELKNAIKEAVDEAIGSGITNGGGLNAP